MSVVRTLVGSFSFVLAIAVAALSDVAEVPGNRESLPFPIWPLPQEARYDDERLLLRDAVIAAGTARCRRRAYSRGKDAQSHRAVAMIRGVTSSGAEESR